MILPIKKDEKPNMVECTPITLAAFLKIPVTHDIARESEEIGRV
jgi:hypothetical protein